VQGYSLEPAFDASKLKYSLTVDSLVEKINIIAKAADGTATVTGNGEIPVSEGENNLLVNVTAQNGSVKTYAINVTVKELNPIKVTVGKEDYTVVRKSKSLTIPSTYTETQIKINDTDVPALKSEITGYTLVGLKDSDGNINLYVYDSKSKTYEQYIEYKFNGITLYPMKFNSKDIPIGYSKSSIYYNDIKLEAYKLKTSSKYALIYGMNVLTGKKNIYMFDSKEDTLQIYNNEELKSLTNKYNQQTKYLYIACAAAGFLLLIIIISIFSKIVKSHNRKKQLKKSREVSDEILLDVNEDNLDSSLITSREQKNIKKRLEKDNEIGAIKHLYVISAYSGQVLIYSTVDTKVTSSGKRLTPKTVIGNGFENNGNSNYVNIGGTSYTTNELIEDDGTFGSSIEYLYWFDKRRAYHQHYISGGQIIHISDQPLSVKNIVLNLEMIGKEGGN
jgi:hypothetical protein